MTDTIPNVPRELLERAWRALANSATGREIGAYLDADPCAPGCAETCVRASMCAACSADLSAPSPANHVEDVRAMVVLDRSKEFSQFLTSVITAAGLLAYGKQSKGLASYLSDKALMYMLAASPAAKGAKP